MVASVPVLTCHVTAVMGLSMAAQTTVSQAWMYKSLFPAASGGERGEDGRKRSHDQQGGQRSRSAGRSKSHSSGAHLVMAFFYSMCDRGETKSSGKILLKNILL